MEPAIRQIDRYLLYPAFASGGMATIHLGRQTGALGVGRVVAIKRLHESLARDERFRSMFLDEARITSGIDHPNVVQTLDVVSTDDELMIVMELVRGDALSRLIVAAATAGQRVPLDIVCAIVAGTLDGLHAAHESVGPSGEALGIVHRDVSPHNILVGEDGVARIADFGIAKALGRSYATQSGEIKGKIAYMPPEQIRSSDVDRRADIYAMAVVLWESLTCNRLYEGPAPSVMFTILEEEPPAPSTHREDISPELDALVLRGLAKSADDRFATALEMARALEAIITPARPRDVGAWVTQWARQNIERQTQMIRQVEAGDYTPSVVRTADATVTGTVSGVTSTRNPPRKTSRLLWPIVGACGLVGVSVAGASYLWPSRVASSSPSSDPPQIALPTASHGVPLTTSANLPSGPEVAPAASNLVDVAPSAASSSPPVRSLPTLPSKRAAPSSVATSAADATKPYPYEF